MNSHRRQIIAATTVTVIALGFFGKPTLSAEYPYVANLKPLSIETDFMSLAGYLRHLVFQQDGTWISLEEAARIVKQQKLSEAPTADSKPSMQAKLPPKKPEEKPVLPVTPIASQPKPAWEPNRSAFGFVVDVQSHSDAEIERALDIASGLGFKIMRATIPWAMVEPNKGNFRFERFDGLVKSAKSRGIDVMFTLAYCPDWASSLPNENPALRPRVRPADVNAWKRYVQATVSHFHDSVRYWQVWERPALQNFRGTQEDYVELLVAAYDAAKKADPTALIFASEPGGPDLGYVAALCRPSVVRSFDGLALAPRADTPEQAARYFDVLKHKILNTPESARKMIFVTEWGYALNEDGKPRSNLDSESLALSRLKDSQRRQAGLAVRAYTVALAMGVQRVFWSELLDPSSADKEHGFYGLLNEKTQPRPVAQAIGRLSAFVPASSETQLYALPDSPARLVSFRTSDQEWRALLSSPTANLSLSRTKIPGVQLTEASRTQSALDDKPTEQSTVSEKIDVGAEPLLIAGFQPVAAELVRTNSWVASPTQPGSVFLDLSDDDEKGGIYNRKYRTWNCAKPELVTEGKTRSAMLTPEGSNLNPFFYCDVDDNYMFFNSGDTVEIVVRANAENPGTSAGFNVMYDSPHGHVFSKWQTMEGGKGWKEYVITLNDAYFANKGGFDFRISALGSRQSILISRVTVTRLTATKSVRTSAEVPVNQ